MNSTDLVKMIGNLSRSLYSVGHLISVFGYIIGILLVMTGVMKLKASAGPHSQERPFVAIAFILGGAALIFSPSMMQTLSNTAFGSGNILQYIQYNPYNIYNSMGLIIQTAGIIWFMRGCVLIVQGSNPSKQEGAKGMTFIGAGILAMNFQYTIGIVNYAMNGLMRLTGFTGG